MVSLHIDGKSYIQEIIDYCVYSFGILCVNNQHYSFIHQHIRDFFASMKIITNMFSPDSRYFIFKPFALSSRCHIELWSTDTCKFIKKIVGYDYSNHVAFSPDEKYILTIDSLCQLKLFAFDKVTGSTSLIHDTEIKHILNYEIPTMTCIQFVCNGKYVLMGDNYGNLFLCDFETILTSPKNIEKHCWILSGHHDSINSISEYIYNDAHYAITSSSDCKVKIWNLQTKKCISSIKNLKTFHGV